ncbi:MAG: hypothetical protein ACJ8EZ_05025, partial [Sphingomicrobium sp.]
AASTPQASPAINADQQLMFGAGAVALLALAGTGVAIARRRRRAQWAEEEQLAAAPVEPVAEPAPAPAAEPQPPIVAPAASAFNWGEPAKCDDPRDDGSDRCPGESWVERAYRGPSPANPSVSLRNRLRRAAFFDQRDREVAAGRAEPVETDAGLPEAMVEEQERELA